MTNFEQLSRQFEQALLQLDRVTAKKIFEDASQTYPLVALVETMIGPTLRRIGAGWETGQVALSQVYMSGRICEDLINTFLPATDFFSNGRPKIAIAGLEDHHTLGKRIIYSALAAAGLGVLDYGVGLTVEQLVARARQDRLELLLISTLMLRAALRIETVTAQLPEVPVIVGGAPFLFDETLWQKVGAVAMGRNSAEAIELVKIMMEKQP